MENASGYCLESVRGESQEWEPQVREEVAALVQARNAADSGLRPKGVGISGPIWDILRK